MENEGIMSYSINCYGELYYYYFFLIMSDNIIFVK